MTIGKPIKRGAAEVTGAMKDMWPEVQDILTATSAPKTDSPGSRLASVING